MPKDKREIKHGSVRIQIKESVNRGKPLFFFQFFEGGVRQQRNFSTEQAARTEAELVARRLALGHGAAVSLTGKDRDSYAHAMHLLQPLGLPLSAVVEEYVAARERLNGVPLLEAIEFFATKHANKLPERTVQEVLVEFLAAKVQDGVSTRYLTDCRHRLTRFAASFRCQIANVQAAEIEDWLRSLSVAPRTRNNFLTLINTLFSFAKSRGYLPKNEKTEAEALSKVKAREGNVEIFQPEEFERLLKCAKRNTLPTLLLGGLAGLRQAEILRLDWCDVDLEGGYVHVAAEKAKTRQRRLVPIHPNLAGWLRPIAQQSGKVANFALPQGLTTAIRAVAESANVEWKNNGLRHSYASYRLAATHDVVKVSLELGNSPQIVFAHYRELVSEKQATKWFSIFPKTQALEPA